ncbi:MAG TPA: flagellar motor protein MotB [Acidimicrobiales bacterium]|nr:flagellar motor protein MotB [Acidimicrobiales bacterium]
MAARRKRHGGHEEHEESHERWLITYADMITLLMVLFIVLFSIGQTDLKKFEKLKAGLEDSFGPRGEDLTLEGGGGVLDGATVTTSPIDSPIDAPIPREVPIEVAMQALREQEAHEASVRIEQHALEEARDHIAAELAQHGLASAVQFRLEARGLIVTVVSDQVLFDLGSAALRPQGREVLDGLAPALDGLPNSLAIEGHTDDRPINGGPFATNWELSTARATSVLRYLVDAHGLAPSRLSASGYADQRPIVPNDTEAQRGQNRRVEVVVLSHYTKETS